MSETKRARLVGRFHNELNDSTSEIWGIGDGCGIYVDFNTCPFFSRKPGTRAFPYSLSENAVTSWQELGYWHYDATGGKAMQELGYEPVEEAEHEER